MATMSYSEIKILRELKENNYTIVEKNKRIHVKDQDGNSVRMLTDSLKNFFLSLGYIIEKPNKRKLKDIKEWVVCNKKCSWL